MRHAGQQQFPTSHPRGPVERPGGAQCGQQGPALRGRGHGAHRRWRVGRPDPDGQQPCQLHAPVLGGPDRQLHPLLRGPERGHEGQQQHGPAAVDGLQPDHGLHPERNCRLRHQRCWRWSNRYRHPGHRHHLCGGLSGRSAHERQRGAGPQRGGGPGDSRPTDRDGCADRRQHFCAGSLQRGHL